MNTKGSKVQSSKFKGQGHDQRIMTKAHISTAWRRRSLVGFCDPSTDPWNPPSHSCVSTSYLPSEGLGSSSMQRSVAPTSSHDPELWRGSIRGELTMLNRCRFVESTCGVDDLEASSSRRVGAAPFDERWHSRVHRGLECRDPCGLRDRTGSGVGGWSCRREKAAQCRQWLWHSRWSRTTSVH